MTLFYDYKHSKKAKRRKFAKQNVVRHKIFEKFENFRKMASKCLTYPPPPLVYYSHNKRFKASGGP